MRIDKDDEEDEENEDDKEQNEHKGMVMSNERQEHLFGQSSVFRNAWTF